MANSKKGGSGELYRKTWSSLGQKRRLRPERSDLSKENSATATSTSNTEASGGGRRRETRTREQKAGTLGAVSDGMASLRPRTRTADHLEAEWATGQSVKDIISGCRRKCVYLFPSVLN